MEMEIAEQYRKFSYIVAVINLGGIPPRLGFLAKIIVVTERLKTKILIISTTLIVISRINIYIYLRIFNFIIIKRTNKTQNLNKSKKSLDKIMILSSLIPILA